MAKLRESEDQRSSLRFPIKLPVEVVAEEKAKLEAETRDISAGGVLFYMEAAMPIGSRIEFNIALPAAVLGTATDVHVKCIGRVVRCEQQGNRRAIAAVIDEYSFERA